MEIQRIVRTGEILPKYCEHCRAIFTGYDPETGRISTVRPESVIYDAVEIIQHKCIDCGLIFDANVRDCPRCKGLYHGTYNAQHTVTINREGPYDFELPVMPQFVYDKYGRPVRKETGEFVKFEP